MNSKTISTYKDWMKTTAFKDFIAVGIIAFQAIVLVQVLELGKTLTTMAKQEAWPIDKFITVPVIIALAITFYAQGRLKERTIELQEAKKLAEAANNSKSTFLSNVSHELRIPIASIKALAETLHAGAIDDAAVSKDFLSKINEEADDLTQLVQELSELSRLESGSAPLKKASVYIAELIASVGQRLKAQADRASLQINIDLKSILPPIDADRDRIEHVLVNLLHNAIKFTPPGGTITVSASSENNNIRVSVTDTGVGIPADDLPRIFERFYKADRARSGGGTGLGLAIVKHIIEAHGGKVWAQSVEGKGATFTFTLPYK